MARPAWSVAWKVLSSRRAERDRTAVALPTALYSMEPRWRDHDVGMKSPRSVTPTLVGLESAARDSPPRCGEHGPTARTRVSRALDQEWAKRWLVPLLDPEDSAQAANLWYAFGWSRTIGPDLLQAIKAPFLEVLRDGEVAARTEHNLTSIFIAVCLEAPNELTHEEISSVVSAMSERELKAVLECLTQRLIGEPSEQAQLWREKVGPWLETYWPAAEARNTAATSNAMVNMLVVCGDAFPEAARWSLNYLRPTEGRSNRPERTQTAEAASPADT